MRLIDLSSPIDASAWEPDDVTHTVLSPADGAEHMASEMRAHFGIDFDVDVLPDREFLNNDLLSLTAHTGTHVDAPAHYGSRCGYGRSRPRTIDELPLEWFHRPGVLVDVSDHPEHVVTAADLAERFARIGHEPAPHDIVLVRTGAAARAGTPAFFTDFIGLDGSAVHYLLDFGVRVIGTDAFSLDAPFTDILRRYREGGDPAVLWPAHFAGRDREYCQIERLANLDQLPGPVGFTVSCFPVKIVGAGAGWARAVALLDAA